MNYGAAGLALTKSFEGCALTAYRDQRGIWTIGYGHTGPDVYEGLTITQTEADALLERDLASAVHAVTVCVDVPLTQNQFDALVDFTFNLGAEALERSTLLRVLNKRNYDYAADLFHAWDHVRGVVVPGLMRRRDAEAALFRQP